MKTCTRCKAEKSFEQFTANKTKKDGYNHECRDCCKAYLKEHYLKNKDYYKKKARKNDAKYAAFYQPLKEKPCMDCGIAYPYYVMDFDHIGEKFMNVSELMKKKRYKEAKLEIEKCELVCANCHRVRTYNRNAQVAKLD